MAAIPSFAELSSETPSELADLSSRFSSVWGVYWSSPGASLVWSAFFKRETILRFAISLFRVWYLKGSVDCTQPIICYLMIYITTLLSMVTLRMETPWMIPTKNLIVPTHRSSFVLCAFFVVFQVTKLDLKVTDSLTLASSFTRLVFSIHLSSLTWGEQAAVNRYCHKSLVCHCQFSC